MSEEKLYRVEARCADCGKFLMGSYEKPHLTRADLNSQWAQMVASAPLAAPRCPGCGFATDRDYNAHLDFFIDDGETVVKSEQFFN